MEEDNAIRAIIIGAGLLMSIAVISAVVIYYNVAKNVAQSAASGVNLNVRYRQDIENTLLKAKVTGSELINLINYFYGDTSITIDIHQMKTIDTNGTVKSVNINGVNKTTSGYNLMAVLDSIRPLTTFNVTKNGSGTNIIYFFTGSDDGV